MNVAVVLISLFAVVYGQNFNGGNIQWYCTNLANEDCSTHGSNNRCGTNNVTYQNRCFLGQAFCKDNTIHQQHEGPCTTLNATRSPEEVQHGSEVILDFQCIMLSHTACTHSINEKICGTDNITYEDFCEYEKARCTHRDLHVAKLGDCSA